MKTGRLTDILNTPVFSDKALPSARTDWRRSIFESTLGDETKSLIREVVKRTRLWSTERHDVAEELVSHFLEGRESGKVEAELIRNFGKPSKAAVMIRRAKKKNRPMLWHLTVVLRNGFLSVIAVYTLTILMAVNKSPSPKIDYKALIDSHIPDIPLETTARETYMALFRNFNIYGFKYSPPESPEWEETVRSFNSTYKQALPEIRKAASYDYSGLHGKYADEFTAEERVILFNMTEEEFSRIFAMDGALTNQPDKKHIINEILTPQISLYRNMCRILAANIIISVSENDWESIPNDIESIFRLTNHCAEQPFYINKLVAIASMWQAHDVTRRLLINPDELPGAGIIRRILDKFNQFGFLCDFDGSFEKYAMKDLIQHCYSENVQGDGVLTKEGIYIAGIWANTQMQEDLYKRQLKWLGLTGDYASIFARPEFMNVILPLIQKESPGRIEITQYLMQLWELAEISASAPLWKLHEYMDQWEKNGKMEYQGAVIEAPSTDNLGHLLRFYEHITPGKMAMRPVLNRTNHDNTRLILGIGRRH
jgi:hypothetical protein